VNGILRGLRLLRRRSPSWQGESFSAHHVAAFFVSYWLNHVRVHTYKYSHDEPTPCKGLSKCFEDEIVLFDNFIDENNLTVVEGEGRRKDFLAR
jgi:hypothetical protein